MSKKRSEQRRAWQKRKQNRRVCPRCRLKSYTVGQCADGRPLFTCNGCKHKWSEGKNPALP